MMGLLDGKVAIITGAGGGIGRAEALLFAREGARLVVNDVGASRDGAGASREPADRVVDEVRAAGGEAVASYDTVATAEGARAIVACAVSAFGGVDVVVNNAGALRDKSFLKTADDDFEALMAVIARGTFHVSQAAARQMVDQRRGGRVVNTTATAGLVGNLGQSAYAAACAAVYGLTRSLAIEMKKHAITVNALAPVARTRMTDDLPMFTSIGDDTLGPAFVAPAALFLASSLCGDLTGEVLAVAGNKLSTWRMAESRGVVGDDPRTPWTAEDIRAKWFALSRSVG